MAASDPTIQLRRLASRGYSQVQTHNLMVPEPVVIRAGRAGGLPFDSLSTDVVQGCLPAARVCFGHCFAASSAFDAGQNFGRRVPNRFDPAALELDLRTMPATQGFVRNGWNSDPSWSWPVAASIAELISASQRLPVLLTKCFVPPSGEEIARMVRSNVELRMTLSAFDPPATVESRLSVCERYRVAGGVAVPVLVTSQYRDPHLASYQDQLVETLILQDFPSAENSLRFRRKDAIAHAIDTALARDIAGTDEMWCGRLYPYTLPVPTITSVTDAYRGLSSSLMSDLDLDSLEAERGDPVPTSTEVLSQPPLPKPKQAGVPRRHHVYQ